MVKSHPNYSTPCTSLRRCAVRASSPEFTPSPSMLFMCVIASIRLCALVRATWKCENVLSAKIFVDSSLMPHKLMRLQEHVLADVSVSMNVGNIMSLEGGSTA